MLGSHMGQFRSLKILSTQLIENNSVWNWARGATLQGVVQVYFILLLCCPPLQITSSSSPALIFSPCRFFRIGVSLCTALAIFIIILLLSAELYLPTAPAEKTLQLRKLSFVKLCFSSLACFRFILTFNNVRSIRNMRGNFFTKSILNFIAPQTLQNVTEWQKCKITKPSQWRLKLFQHSERHHVHGES